MVVREWRQAYCAEEREKVESWWGELVGRDGRERWWGEMVGRAGGPW